jgi:hypothetical protein
MALRDVHLAEEFVRRRALSVRAPFQCGPTVSAKRRILCSFNVCSGTVETSLS